MEDFLLPIRIVKRNVAKLDLPTDGLPILLVWVKYIAIALLYLRAINDLRLHIEQACHALNIRLHGDGLRNGARQLLNRLKNADCIRSEGGERANLDQVFLHHLPAACEDNCRR